MAPALAIAHQEPHAHDNETLEDGDKLFSHRRRALASVDNLATHMEEDDMGLQNQPSLAKDSQEMEQILVDLGNSDLAPDLLQAIKTLESGGDGLSTGDADAIFPLSGFDLPDAADSEGDAVEDKIKVVQTRLERRCAFLQRRLRILQARAIGKRISEEATETFEKCIRAARKDGGGRPVGLKTFLKTIETTAALQANASSRTVVSPKYFKPGTSKGDACRSASLGIPSGTLAGLEDTAGALRTHLSMVKHELDSDATASSSGAESNDEAVTYNNPHQQHMPIEKRALWSWQRARASIASRWCWLQAQVQELEYKIRQHNDLHKQVREAKGAVEFEGEPPPAPSPPVGYLGSLPGSSQPVDDELELETCARVRPLRRETFKKRKLLQMHNLHIATNKAAKPSDIKCSCVYGAESCGVCTGRGDPTQPAPPAGTLAPRARLARLDAAYHPVLSDLRDLPASAHVSTLLSTAWFRSRLARGGRAAPRAPPAHAAPAPRAAHLPRRHPSRLKRGRPPLSRKIREREREEETSTSGQERSRGRSSTETRSYRRQSYDIDNIVIPQSVAANTRPQILTYKEIITPKWRVMEIPETPLNNGVMKSNRMSVESDEDEDISEAAVAARHLRAEHRERSRYTRKPRPRRVPIDAAPDAHAPDGPHAPDGHHAPDGQHAPDGHRAPDGHHSPDGHRAPHVPQAPDAAHVPQPPTETVRPYTPRQFPLRDEQYLRMVSVMPAAASSASASASASPRDDDDADVEAERDVDVDDSSTLSPASPTAFDGDDPDDAEWDPTSERLERRKSTFR